MKQYPEVSVIVPLYNAEKYIGRCLGSLLAQTFKNIEVIIINDGSTDRSKDIANEFCRQDSRISIFDFPNRGVSSARNEGIIRAKGEWILFVDADDYIDKDTIEILLNTQARHNVDTVLYSFYFEFENTTKSGLLPSSYIHLRDLLEERIKVENPDIVLCSPFNKLYNKKIIIDNKIRFDSDLPYGEDFEFNSKYFSYAHNIVLTSQVLYHYDCSIGNSGVKKVRQNFDIIINKMDKAFVLLLQNLECDSSLTCRFRKKFISERWRYAIYLLLNSSESVETKVNLLLRWRNAISDDMMRILMENSENSGIYEILSIEDMTQRRRKLRIYTISDEIKRRYIRFKVFVKKII